MTQMTPSSVHAKYPATFTRPSDEESESRGAGNQATCIAPARQFGYGWSAQQAHLLCD